MGKFMYFFKLLNLLSLTYPVKEKVKKKTTFYPTVSFIFIVKNCESKVSNEILKLFSFSRSYKGFCEIIFVDNGSEDCTYEIGYATLKVAFKKWPKLRVKILRQPHEVNLRNTASLGAKAALGQIVTFILCGNLTKEDLDLKVFELRSRNAFIFDLDYPKQIEAFDIFLKKLLTNESAL